MTVHFPRAPVNPLFPSPPSDAAIDRLLEHAVRAPSGLNTQPWRFVIDMGAVHIYADRSRQLRSLDPLGREMTMSCGAAVLYLRVTARHAGWDTIVLPFPLQQAPDLVAAVTFRPRRRSDSDDPLFRALATRRTGHHSFSSTPLPPGLGAELTRAAAAEGATVHVFESPADKGALARLVSAGVAQQDSAAAADVAAWHRHTGVRHADGVQVPVDAPEGMLEPPVAGDKGRLVRDAPAVVVLSTAGDERADWLTAGQALARVLAVAAQHGLVSAYADEPVESERLRASVATLVGGGYPQVVVRIGYAVPGPATVRRPTHDVTRHAASTSPPRPSGLTAPGSAAEATAEATADATADATSITVMTGSHTLPREL